MKEAEVEDVFAYHLRREGWVVSVEAKHKQDYIDVLAKHPDGTVLIAEVKGETKKENAGVDVDVLYGQILRRMKSDHAEGTRYALVVPEMLIPALERVDHSIRAKLNLEVFIVKPTGEVFLSV